MSAAGAKSNKRPDAETQYRNSNYVLLGYIIEELSNTTYREQLQARICDKIGLKRTSYMTSADAQKNVAISFRWSGKEWLAVDQTDPSIPHGAGAIMSTVSDLTRFAEALFDGKLVGDALVKEMAPSELGMGHGLFAFPFGTRRAFGHYGGIDGFQSMLGHFQEDGVSVSVIGNGVNYSVNDVVIGLLSIVFDRPYKLPDFSEVKVPEKALQRYTGIYARKNFPLKITVTISDGELVAQGSGQPSFPLTPSSETEFRSDAVGAVMTFSQSSADSDFDTMTLKQGGQNLEFRKE
jgi:D-alanyl-D-alanine carboxypeptidase